MPRSRSAKNAPRASPSPSNSSFAQTEYQLWVGFAGSRGARGCTAAAGCTAGWFGRTCFQRRFLDSFQNGLGLAGEAGGRPCDRSPSPTPAAASRLRRSASAASSRSVGVNALRPCPPPRTAALTAPPPLPPPLPPLTAPLPRPPPLPCTVGLHPCAATPSCDVLSGALMPRGC